MKTKIEIKSILGDVLFEFETGNNTIKDTVEEAVKRNANMRGAKLYGAFLCGANLPIFCKWSHAIQDGNTRIGRKVKSMEEW